MTERFGEVIFAAQRLRVTFATDEGPVHAVRDVSFAVRRGQTLGIVGESGSGKTVSCLAALGLHDPRTTTVTADKLHYAQHDLLRMPPSELRKLRGDRLAVVFQDSMAALNPYLRIGVQLCEVLMLHRGLARAEAETLSAALLGQVGIADARERMRSYPHELSGGMRQRVAIAMALLCAPAVVLADEPTTALDVTIQAQVLKLMRDLQMRSGMAMVLVTHDMGVIAHMADHVLVMYGGLVLESAPVDVLFSAPRHPYTAGLLASLPRARGQRPRRLFTIAGVPPRPQEVPVGCVFAPRCGLCEPRCRLQQPPQSVVADDHSVRCFRADEVPQWARKQWAARGGEVPLG